MILLLADVECDDGDDSDNCTTGSEGPTAKKCKESAKIPSKKRKRKQYSDGDGKCKLNLGLRQEIVQHLEDIQNDVKGRKFQFQAAIATHYKVSKATITQIKNNAASYKRAAEKGYNKDIKRTKLLDEDKEDLDDALIAFIDKAERLFSKIRLGLSARMIMKKAEDIAKDLFLKGTDGKPWRPSNGWYCRFLKRKHLTRYKLYGEAGDYEADFVKKEIDEIKEILLQYELDHIFNMDGKAGCIDIFSILACVFFAHSLSFFFYFF